MKKRGLWRLQPLPSANLHQQLHPQVQLMRHLQVSAALVRTRVLKMNLDLPTS